MLVVIVNGLPGAGKTTLARPLGAALGLPVFVKDRVKELLADMIPGDADADAAWGRTLGATSMEMMWALLADSTIGAVVEAPMLAHMSDLVLAGLRRAGVEPATIQEVWCEVPIEIAAARYEERSTGRHPIHRDTTTDNAARFANWADKATPLGTGAVHRVDTTRPVDVGALADAIRVSAGARVGTGSAPLPG